MLKKRIIPIQLLDQNRLVKSINFNCFRDVGDPISSSSVYNAQLADELIFLDISRDLEKKIHFLGNILEEVSKVSFMPLSVGGKISSYEDACFLIKKGADKVVINTAAYLKNNLLKEISDNFGSQSLVVSIDVILEKNRYFCVSNNGRKLETSSLEEHINFIESNGAGEILIQSIDCDGKMQGMDMVLLKKVCDFTNLPVIACGGVGNCNHLKEVFLNTEVSAVACGSLFNFTDTNLIRAKSYLSNYDIPFKKV